VPFGQFHIVCKLVQTSADQLKRKDISWTIKRRFREFNEIDELLRVKLGWKMEQIQVRFQVDPASLFYVTTHDLAVPTEIHAKQARRRFLGGASLCFGRISYQRHGHLWHRKRRSWAPAI